MFEGALFDLYPDSKIITLLNDEASSRNVLRGLRELRESQSPLCIFYFSGHGCSTDVDAYLITPDGEEGQEGIALSTLVKQLSLGPDRSWLAVLDCCHATPTEFRSTRLQERDIDAALGSYGSNRAVIAACEPSKEAVTLGGSSPFTAAIIEALTGSAANHAGEVTLGAAFDCASDLLNGKNLPSPALLGDLSSRFTLAFGLPPKGTRPLTNESRRSLINDAQRFATALRNNFSVSDADWKEEGWQDAQRRLLPVVRWFRRVKEGHPELLRDPGFKDALSGLDRYSAYLASINTGTRTDFGTVGSRLGQGGFGTVWKLMNGDNLPQHAIKMYHADQLHDREKTARFERGYRAMQQLDNPRIVRVVSYVEAPPAIVMEFVDGSDLRTFDEHLDVPEIVGFLTQVAATLGYAHSRGIIHRDVKPENVILRRTPEGLAPTLTDFDLAWFPTATQITQAAMGHAYYAAPEQLQDPESGLSRNPAVDVYAFGQLLFFSVTRRDPRPLDLGENLLRLSQHLETTQTSHSVRNELLSLYAECTQLDRKSRPGLGTVIARLRDVQHLPPDAPRSLSFPAFCAELLGRAQGRLVSSPSSKRAYGESKTGRTKIECILHEEQGKQTVRFRMKVFDLPGERSVGGFQTSLRKNRRRATAMKKADEDAQVLTLGNGGGFKFVQLDIEVSELEKDAAITCGRRIQRIVSAGERVQV